MAMEHEGVIYFLSMGGNYTKTTKLSRRFNMIIIDS